MKTILVIDDSEIMRKLLHELLTRHDYRILSADSVDTALAIARTEPLTALLTDLHLAGQTGLALCRTMRAAGYTFPIWIMSGSETRDLTEEVLEAGAVGFIRKPFNPTALLQQLEAVLGVPA